MKESSQRKGSFLYLKYVFKEQNKSIRNWVELDETIEDYI